MLTDKYLDTYTIVEQLVDTTYKQFGSYSFAAGMLTGIVTELVSDLPKNKRKEAMLCLMDRLESRTKCLVEHLEHQEYLKGHAGNPSEVF